MASKYFFFIMAFCFLQFAQSATLDKRGLESLIQDAVNQVTSIASGLISSIVEKSTQALSTVQNYIDQATGVKEASKGPLETLLQSAIGNIEELVSNALQFGWNSNLCVFEQTENVKRLVKETEVKTVSCIQNEIQWTLKILDDVTIVKNDAAKAISGIYEEVVKCNIGNVMDAFFCVPHVAEVTVSKLLLQLSVLVSDLYTLAERGVQLPDRLTKCSAEQLLKATVQVGEIISNAGVCVKGVAQNS